MADTEFEQFRQCFEKLPQHIRAPAPFYSLVPDVLDDDESPTSSKSDEECCEYDSGVAATSGAPSLSSTHTIGTDVDEYVVQRIQQHGGGNGGGGGGDEIRVNSPLMMQHQQQLVAGGSPARSYGGPPPPPWMPPGERRRRKLPEIPKSKRAAPNFTSTCNSIESAGPPSLASELASVSLSSPAALIPLSSRTVLRRDTGDSSPDSERPYTDVDSGHSTAHSPIEGAKSLSPPFRPHFEMLEATHRGLHKFVPRHRDEIEVEIGDPIYVQKEADDLWCEGVNLRTGRAGIFPSAYAVDTDYSEFDPSCEQVRRERYLLGYLGSVETLAHKGTAVVCQATRRVAGCQLHACVLEVSDRGLRMVDRTKPAPDQPCIDYFYSLKNVSFCAFHPRDHRYLGFITKHPTLQRFACHIFMGAESTRPVAEAVGRAFQRFYQKFIETAYPIEDIYIE